MKQSDQEVLESFKRRIERENKNNPYLNTRRRFSKKLKKDILKFANESSISKPDIARELSLLSTSISNWEKQYKPVSTFKKVIINQENQKKVSVKNRKKKIEPVMMNQMILIILLTLHLIERVLFHLNS
ncbi:MAG: transposase [Desulfobacteraceae bacterium]|nr:transposase [Desulfobacteraceae bacterium]